MPARAAKGTSTRGGRRAAAASSGLSNMPSLPPPGKQQEPPNPTATYSPLQTAVSTIFNSAQRTTAGHRKLATNLRAIHEQCVEARGVGAATGGGRAGEKAFGREFIRNLNKVLLVKKGELVGDRCIRFCDLFVKGIRRQQENDDEQEEEQPLVPSPASRFILSLLKYLLPFVASREKTVRYRTSQLLALLLSKALSGFPIELESSVFRKLRNQLAKRMQDKEAIVRVQAAVGLIRLLDMGVDDLEDDEEESADDDDDLSVKRGGLVGVIIGALQNDPSADVRRIILYNLTPTQTTLPYLLERTRDVDNVTRRSVFSRLLPSLGDFRLLSINMREKLLRWGLNDRDEGVRAAAGKMFNYRWIEDAKGDLLEVLERMHVVGSGSGDNINGGVKELAMKGFWQERKDVVDGLELDDAYWENLTPESAFLVRSFNDWCRSSKHQGKFESLIEEKLPEVTKLAYHLQIQLNKLIGMVREEQNGAKAQDESNESVEQEFIVEQLLMIAASMDYGDEIGRRKMFQLLRDALAIIELPEGVTKLVVQCLAKLSLGEADFCMLIMEVIAEIHDTITEAEEEGKGNDDDDSDDEVEDDDDAADQLRQEAEAESKAFKILVRNIKTLHLAQYMLENVYGSLTQNTHLVSMLNGLVVPAVRSHEAIIRELGLRCLGLSCMLDRNLAEENLALFAHCFNKGHEALQIEALKIISDMLMVHGASLFEGDTCRLEQKTLYKLLSKALKLEDNVEVQAAAAEVTCKLMLAQVIKDEDVSNNLPFLYTLLKALVVAYFDLLTRDNMYLRQILSYFFPVYCHSRAENQSRMQEIAAAALHALVVIYDSLEADEEMVAPTLIATHLVDWTDPRKQVGGSARKPSIAIAGPKFTESVVDPSVHVKLANDLLDRMTSSSCHKEERKLLISMLGKLYLPKEAEPELLRSLYDKISLAIEKKVAGDAFGRNALNKLEVIIGKIVSGLADEQDEEQGKVEGERGGEVDQEMGEAGAEEEEAEDDEDSDGTVIKNEEESEDDGF
ncbi:nuclear condensing complex subunit [Kalaharituber pfeilii]|nr:nuclear condensing complex subunit [Kalaharituber pfeilii]